MSLYTLSFLRTATLPSENARKKATRAKKDSDWTAWPSAAALRHARTSQAEALLKAYLHLDLSQPHGIEQHCGCSRLNISIQSDGDRLIINFRGSNDIPVQSVTFDFMASICGCMLPVSSKITARSSFWPPALPVK